VTLCRARPPVHENGTVSTDETPIDPRDLGDGLKLRLLEPADAEALTELVAANREHLAPWDPERDEEHVTLDRQRELLDAALGRFGNGTEVPFGIVVDGHLAGRVTLSNVVRGPLQSANLGYWIDHRAQGRGLVRRAVGAVVEIARDDLGLHRLEAGTLVHNERSQAVLERAGFERIGLARGLLMIAGRWQDHVLFQRLLHDGSGLRSR